MKDGAYYCSKCEQTHSRGKIYEAHINEASVNAHGINERDFEELPY